MNILFTTFQGGIAGSSYSILELAKGLKGLGHEIHFAGRPEMELFKQLEKERITCHSIRFASYFDLYSARQLAILSEKFTIDVVNAQSGLDRTVVIWSKWFFGLKSKVIFTRRQQPIDEPWFKRKLHVQFADKIICTSNSTKSDFIKRGYPESFLEVIPNGIREDLIPQMTSDFKSSFLKKHKMNGPIIGCISRKKRQDLIISSISLLPPKWTYLFVGVSEKDISVPDAVKHQVIFTGRIPREEALKYYSAMDVNILPTDAEGFGMTVLESMLAGVPIMASKVGGVRELIDHEKNGILFDNTPKDLQTSLNKVILNPSFSKKLVEKGRITARNTYALSNTVQLYERFFEKIVSLR